MSRMLTISDELYARLEAEARSRSLDSIEHLLEEWERNKGGSAHHQTAVQEIDGLRERLFAKYGEMSDSTELVREDRDSR